MYSHLLEGLTGQKFGPRTAQTKLSNIFRSKETRSVTVLILDEMDAIVTRDQKVIKQTSCAVVGSSKGRHATEGPHLVDVHHAWC